MTTFSEKPETLNPSYQPPIVRTAAGTRIVENWPYSTGPGDSYGRSGVARLVEAVEIEAAELPKADRRRSCRWCGHRYGDHARTVERNVYGSGHCLAFVDDPDRTSLQHCFCHGWEPLWREPHS